MKNLFLILFFIAIAVVGVSYGYSFYTPCNRPIAYSLGTFDADFGMSRSQFLNDLDQAVSVWEKAAGKDLFQYSEKAGLDVNLVYDYRQKATSQLQDLDVVIKDDKAGYDILKNRYDSLSANYDRVKASLEASVANYEARKKSYEEAVAYWNNHSGAPKGEYDKLQETRHSLNAEAAALKSQTDSLNNMVETINAAANDLNRLARKLNLNVNQYNTVGASTGREFSEGEYVSDQNGERINIYQFNNEAQLVRVLEHEFGHALSLDHVSDPKAIMYYLNEGVNGALTAADIAQLKAVCRMD